MKIWKFLLGVFFALVVFDGALRKWVAPGLSTVLLLLKDAVLVGSILSYAFRHPLQLPGRLSNTWLPVCICFYVFWISLEAFNLNVPSLAVTVLGLKSYLLYLSLLILVPAAFYEMRRPGQVAIIGICVFILPVLLLGIYQFYHPTTHWINRYVGEAANVVGVGGRPRITGTFSYIAGMSTFALFSLSVSFGVLLVGLLRNQVALSCFGAVLMFLSIVVAPMTGSRSVVIIPMIAFPPVLLLVFSKQKLQGSPVIVLIVFFIAFAGLFQWAGLSGGWEVVMSRFEGNESETAGRMTAVFTGPLEKLRVAGITGYGAGTAMPASTRVAPNPAEWQPPTYFEGEKERILLEVGPLGLLLYLVIKIWVTVLSYRTLRRAQNPIETGICATAFLFILMHSASGAIVASAVTGAIYWGMAGITVAVWNQQEVQEAIVYQWRRSLPN